MAKSSSFWKNTRVPFRMAVDEVRGSRKQSNENIWSLAVAAGLTELKKSSIIFGQLKSKEAVRNIN